MTRSLMMVTYNRLDLTKQTVKNIYETTKDFNYIIVDNGSTDGTVEYLKALAEEKDNVHLHLYEENKGIAMGRNKALKMADDIGTEWYSTIDNDVLLFDGWLDQCIDILKDCKMYGSIGVSFENKAYPIVNVNGHEFENKPRGNLGTACTVFYKNLHKMIGFFTTEYEKYGEEDADWGARARFAGFKLGHLKQHGNHIGEGENDIGEYREFKDECRKKNLAKFHANCTAYAKRQKSLYIPYKED